MELTIKGRIKASDSGNVELRDCRMEVFLENKPSKPTMTHRADNALDIKPVRTTDNQRADRGRVTVRTDPRGKFEVTIAVIPPLNQATEVQFVVSSPAGQQIGRLSIPLEKAVETLVEIPVDASGLTPVSLEVPAESRKPARIRVNGRVIDRNGRSIKAGTQVILVARKTKTDAEDGLPIPVLVARTDSAGYFFGEVPYVEYADAIAQMAGIKEDLVVKLEDGHLPARLILVVEASQLADAGSENDDCGSKGVLPYTPSQEDIDNSPGTYSSDLGTGRCVDFNTPNRAIEEFDFYTVVRTTEPDIIGFTAGGVSSASHSRATEVLATLTTAVQAANGAVATARQIADAAALKVEQAGGVKELDQLYQAFKTVANNPNGWVRQKVEEALTAKGTATWSEAKVRNELIELLVRSDGLPAAIATQIAGILVDAIIVLPASELDERGFSGTFSRAHYAADQIVYAATEGARATAATAGIVAEADVAASEAAKIKLAEAINAYNLAVAAETAKKNEIARQTSEQERKSQSKPRAREQLNAKNPVDWDDTPTFYQAAEIAHGHLLHFKQVWYADGYSLGDLLYSLPLAPGQKKLISVVDWERRERTERAEETTSNESLIAALSRDRDLGEVVTGTLSESSRGGSKSTTASVGAGTAGAGNGSYQGFNFGALLGVSGGYGEANSSAWQDSTRNLASSSLQNLRDRTLQSASAIRGLRSSVVHTVTQGEAVSATTEVVANHNHCHAMTVQYFEVLRHLKLQHELAGVQECLFVPLPMSEFDLAKTLRWRQELQNYLKLPRLAGGFDAARRISTFWSEVDSPLQRYADESVTSLSGELQLTVHIPLPPFPERPKPRPEDTATATAQAVADAVNPTTGALGVLLAVVTGGASLIVGAATSAAIKSTQAAAAGARALADSLYGETPEERYNRFHHDVVPGVVEAFINNLELWALVNGRQVQLKGVDFTLASEYQPGIPLLVSLRSSLAGQQKRAEISQLIIKSRMPLPSNCRAVVNTVTIRYRTSSFEHLLINDNRVNDDVDPPKAVAVFNSLFSYDIRILDSGSGATLFTPIDAWEQRSPRTEDRRRAGELIDHLNDNVEYYHHAIWWAMDPNRRYMLLDGYYAPGANNRSVASVVENRLIGIVGNSVILPVAPGIHLDPRIKYTIDDNGQVADLMDLYRQDAPVPPARVSLPTRGVFAEAVMGACNSCEKIDDSRFWRWEDSPIDEPPAIDTASTTTRRSEPADVHSSPFPTPIVSIQNAPAVPDPVGVRAALDALGKQSFADITGLAGTQANAAAAYQQALDTAYKFGKEASALAQQAAMLKSKDKVLGSIDEAESSGKIDKEDAKKYRNNTFEKLTFSEPPMVEAQPSTEDEWAPWPGVPDNPEPESKDRSTPTAPTPKPKPKKTILVSIKLRVFVPPEIWEPYPDALSLSGVYGGALGAFRYNGDNRSFSFNAGSSRAEMEYSFRINTETLEVTEAAEKRPVNYGWARVYLATDTTDVNGKPEWWESLDAGATPFASLEKKMKHDESRFYVDADTNSERVEISFVLSAQPYFPWSKNDLPTGDLDVEVFGLSVRDVIGVIEDFAAADIDALVKITITRKPNGMLQYSVSGHHDKFPAYELYVNGEAAYQWGTEAQLSEAGPAGLRSSMTIEVDQDKVIKTPPVPLFL